MNFEDSDWYYLERFICDDAQNAFSELVKRHGEMVYAACLRVLDDVQMAEDASQAVFILLAKKADSLSKKTILSGWLYRCAIHVSRDMKKSWRRRIYYEKRAAALEPEMAIDELSGQESVWLEIRPLLDDLIDALPGRLRETVVLCLLEGKTQREAAELLACKENTLCKRLKLAKEKLQKRLLDQKISVSTGLLTTLIAVHAKPSVEANVCARINEAIWKREDWNLLLTELTVPVSAQNVRQQVLWGVASVVVAGFLLILVILSEKPEIGVEDKRTSPTKQEVREAQVSISSDSVRVIEEAAEENVGVASGPVVAEPVAIRYEHLQHFEREWERVVLTDDPAICFQRLGDIEVAISSFAFAIVYKSFRGEPLHPLRHMFRYRIFTAWLEEDPRAAIEWIDRRMPLSNDRNYWATLLLMPNLILDPPELDAFYAAMASGEEMDYDQLRVEFVLRKRRIKVARQAEVASQQLEELRIARASDFGERGLARRLAGIEMYFDGEDRIYALVDMVREYAKVNAEKAREILEKLPDEDALIDGLRAYAEGIAEVDPGAALEMLVKVPGLDEERVEEIVVLGIVKDPYALGETLLNIECSDSELSQFLFVINQFAMEWGRIDFSSAIVWTEKFQSEDQDQLIAHMLRGLAQKDPREALEYTFRVFLDSNGNSLKAELFQSFVLQNLWKAIDWLEGMQDNPFKQELQGIAIRHAMGVDPVKTFDYVVHKEIALESLLALELTRHLLRLDEAVAMQWLEQIPDKPTKDRALQLVAHFIFERNPRSSIAFFMENYQRADRMQRVLDILINGSVIHPEVSAQLLFELKLVDFVDSLALERAVIIISKNWTKTDPVKSLEWTLSLTEISEEEAFCSDLRRAILKEVLRQDEARVKSWLVKAPISVSERRLLLLEMSDSDQIH